MSDAVKITSLELENVKKVRMVRLEPTENGLTVIGGGNRAGKTSVLDGICYALGGEKFRPTDLQNSEGLNPARMEIRLSNGLVVVREGKNAALKVTDPDGRKGGQKLLDTFVGAFALNLPAFMQAKTADKARALLDVLGVGDRLAALDQEERKWYEERTLSGREADKKKKYAESLPEHPDVPEEPLNSAELTREMTETLAFNARQKALRDNIKKLKDDYDTEEGRLRMMEQRLSELQEQIDVQKKRVSNACHDYNVASSVSIPQDQDTSSIQKKLDELEEINVKVRQNLDKAAALDEAKHAQEEVMALTAKVEDVRSRRMALLKSVKMPLAGLSVEDGELVYGGRKWDCMSTAEQMKVSAAVCRAMKPECGFVLVDRLESFDLKELREFAGWAEAEGLQVIGTRVSDGGECTIVIEDGTVKGASEWDEPPAPEIVKTPPAVDDDEDF